jgi:hypothetical protein
LNYWALRRDNSGPEPVAKRKATWNNHCVISRNPVLCMPQKVGPDSQNFVKHVVNVTIAIAAGENGNADPCHLGRGNFDATRINIFVMGLKRDDCSCRYRMAALFLFFIRYVWSYGSECSSRHHDEGDRHD